MLKEVAFISFVVIDLEALLKAPKPFVLLQLSLSTGSVGEPPHRMVIPVGRCIITYTIYCVNDSPTRRFYKKILNYISAIWQCSRQAFCLTYCNIARKVHCWNAKWLGNPHCTSVIQ